MSDKSDILKYCSSCSGPLNFNDARIIVAEGWCGDEYNDHHALGEYHPKCYEAKDEKLTRLTAQNAALVEALEFYATELRYIGTVGHTIPDVMADGGDKARTALDKR